MRERKVVMLPATADVLRQLPPDRKRKVRAALAALRRNAAVGEPLERELTGLSRLRVGSLRIVYRETVSSVVVIAIGPRRTIYTELERQARGA